jgi:hypothetical protein
LSRGRGLTTSVSDLDVGRKSDLPPPRELDPAAGRCPPYGVPQRIERSFNLCDQLSDGADVLLRTLLHEASRRLARRLRGASYFHWKYRAVVEVRTDAIGQVRVTPWALVCTDAERIKCGNLLQVEPPSTTNALSDVVIPTVDDEKSTLLGAQNTRPTTIEMTEKPAAEDDGVVWRDRS